MSVGVYATDPYPVVITMTCPASESDYWMSRMSARGQVESREVFPGVWQHTYTPDEIHAPSATDLLDFIDAVREHARQTEKRPFYFEISPDMEQQLKKLRHRELWWIARTRRTIRLRKIARRHLRARFRRRTRGQALGR